ncbi:MAG: hypothetical protein V3T70_07290 [Phycisphaerae bacterium]
MNPFLRILEALNASRVRYVVVRGFAALMHGHNRFTADLDIVVDPAAEHARKAIEALVAIGFHPRLPVDAMQFADPAIRAHWAREKNMMVFSMLDPNSPAPLVELLDEPPKSIDKWMHNPVILMAGATSVPVCSIGDLIEMKVRSGRPQDQLDVENLRLIQKNRKRGP